MKKKINISDISDIEKAYWAGFVDGEGCISINKYTDKKKYLIYRLIITVANTNKEIIYELKRKFKGIVSIRKIMENRKVCYSWKVSSKNAYNFLRLISPFLRVKRKQGELAYEFLKLFFTKEHPVNQENMNKRIEIMKQFHILNKRGI